MYTAASTHTASPVILWLKFTISSVKITVSDVSENVFPSILTVCFHTIQGEILLMGSTHEIIS